MSGKVKVKFFFSYIITNWIDPNNSSATSDQKINFVGEKGRFFSDQKNRGIQFASNEKNFSHINPYFTNLNFSEKYFFDGYVNERFNKKLNSTFYDSLVSTKVIEAVNKSLQKKGQVIFIK